MENTSGITSSAGNAGGIGSVDVKINGQDGIVVVPRGGTVTVSWTTTGVARCDTTTSFAPWGPYVSKPVNGSEQMTVSQGLTVGLQCARTLTSPMEFIDSTSGIRLTQCTDGVDNDNDGLTDGLDSQCNGNNDDDESVSTADFQPSVGIASTSIPSAASALPAGSIQGPSVCDTICGDGVVMGDELCDDGNRINTDACNNNCGRASSSSSSSASSSKSSLAACIPGTICPTGDICPLNGFCPQASSASSTGIACIPGTICPTGDICPINGFCPPFSSSSSSSVRVCVPGTQCPDGAICPQNGQCPVSSSSSSVGRCVPGTLCPTGGACPVNGVCPVQCVPGTICPTGDTCPQNGVCPQESSSSSAGVESCTINADCPSNLCLGGYCSCTGSEQCEGNACIGGFCANIHAAADLVAFATCASDKECPVNMLCQDGYCAPDLALCGNGIVDAGEVCDDGNDVDIDGCTASCLLSDGAACSNPRQCRSLICKDGVCTPCVSDNECPDDMACVEGACTAVNPLDPDNDGMVVLSDGYKIAASLFSQLGSDARPENLSYEDYLLLMQQHAAGHAPVGNTGPESVAIMTAGASAGYAWMKMRKMKKGK